MINPVEKQMPQIMLLTLFTVMGGNAALSAQSVKKELVDTAIVLGGKTVIVEQEVWQFEGETDRFARTITSYVLKDATGKQLFSRDFPETEVTENGFGDEFHIGPYTISTPGKEALAISHWYYPSAPGTGEDLQFFVWQKDNLIPLSKPFDSYGSHEKIARTHAGINITLSGTETILMIRYKAYHFYLDIPVIINLDPSAERPYRTGLPKDPESSLDIIPITAKRHPGFMDDKSAEVTLYKSAQGEAFSTIGVNRESTIEIGPAYGTAAANENERGAGVSVKIQRLKVTIDGKTGCVEEKDYQKLGLPAFG